MGFLSTLASQLLHSTCGAKCSGISGSEGQQCTGGLFLTCINIAAGEICGILIALELQCPNAFLSAYSYDSPFSFLSSHEREGKKILLMFLRILQDILKKTPFHLLRLLFIQAFMTSRIDYFNLFLVVFQIVC